MSTPPYPVYENTKRALQNFFYVYVFICEQIIVIVYQYVTQKEKEFLLDNYGSYFS